MLEGLGPASTWVLLVLLALMALLTVLVAGAQIGCIRGRPFQNPDGTVDDWREQKIFYGMAWADLLVACPLSFVSIALVFAHPRLGLMLLVGVGTWLLWANVMTTVTSLRFEKPRLTMPWLVVFPFGGLVGAAYLAWILVHFRTVFG